MKSLHVPAIATLVLVMLVGVACDRAQESTDATPGSSSETTIEAVATPPPETTEVAEEETSDLGQVAYQRALDMGMRAAIAAQSAYSISDWDLVNRRWQVAIDFLRAVPESSQHYANAQIKISEYEANAAIARQQQVRLKTPPAPAPSSVPAPPPASTTRDTPSETDSPSGTGPLCQSGIPQTDTVVLSNLQIRPSDFVPIESNGFEMDGYLVGCITNWSDRALTVEYLPYKIISGPNYKGGLGAVVMPRETLLPGESLPWYVGFTFFDTIDQFTIEMHALIVRWEDGEMEEFRLNSAVPVDRAQL